MQSSLTHWQAMTSLRGKVLRREETQLNTDDSGSSYYSESQRLLLYGDFTFRFEHRCTFVAVASMTVVTANSPLKLPQHSQINIGTWFVKVKQGRTALVLNHCDDSEFTWWYSEAGEPGIHYLDGKPWQRDLIG